MTKTTSGTHCLPCRCAAHRSCRLRNCACPCRPTEKRTTNKETS